MLSGQTDAEKISLMKKFQSGIRADALQIKTDVFECKKYEGHTCTKHNIKRKSLDHEI